MTIRLSHLTVCVLALTACDSGFEQRQKAVNLWSPGDIATPSRITAAYEWDTLWSFPSATSATVRAKPRTVVAGGRRVYLFDDSTHRVVALSDAGVPLWEFSGQPALSPALGTAIDLKPARDGNLYVLDAQNSRILIVNGSGQIAQRVPLPKSPRAFQIAPLDSDRILVLPILGSSLTVFDHSGKLVSNVSLPWSGFAKLNPLARQGATVSNPDGTWVFAFGLGDGWFAFHGTRPLGFVGKYVEYRPFPVVTVQKQGKVTDMVLAEYAPCTGCAVSLSDSSVFILAGGSSSSQREVVDEFALGTGAYLRSFRLPSAMTGLSVANGVYYGITKDETPRLVALRPRRTDARTAAAHVARLDTRASSGR